MTTMPCMRVVVQSTAIADLRIGTLFVVTIEGGTLGREGTTHAILLRDPNVSKHHLRFTFDRDRRSYSVTDLGSRNGTLLNGRRMSTAKCESDPMSVVHGSKIEVGSTILLCHVHNGNATCGHCEPGLVMRQLPADSVISAATGDCDDGVSRYDKARKHKDELKKLRKKFGLATNAPNANSDQANRQHQQLSLLADGYTDRAQVRRDTVGSTDHNEKTQMASVDESIAPSNKGFKLLAKMGWSEGQTLGKKGQGLLEPINQMSNQGTSGLGHSSALSTAASSSATLSRISGPVVDKSVKLKMKNWSKAQERYRKICSDNTEVSWPSDGHDSS